ncbi:MAG: hypothetical protein IJT13_00695 [Bacteroidaceae bacterium]|nr:hypothetical protein [Bacteroidaceae bacterium]
MKHKSVIFVLLSAAILSSCSSSQQLTGAYMGSNLGGAIGSVIGGVSNGPRGSFHGQAIGMIAGGVAGAVIMAPKKEKESISVAYPTVTSIHYIDANGNERIGVGEIAHIEMDIFNESDETMYDITPYVYCNNRNIIVSRPIVIKELAPKKGIRYTIAVSAQKKIKSNSVAFEVSFGQKKSAFIAAQFAIPVSD